MVNNFKDLFVNFMIYTVLIFSLLTLVITFQSENEVEQKMIEDARINSTFQELNEDLSEIRNTSQRQMELFESENPTSGFGTILLFSIVSTGKVFKGILVGVFNTIISLPTTFLGLDPIYIAIISTILIITIIIFLWSLYKLGG